MKASRILAEAKRALDPAKSTMTDEVVIDRNLLQKLVDNYQGQPSTRRHAVSRYLQCSLETVNPKGMPLCSKSSEVCPGFKKCRADHKPKKVWSVVAYRYGKHTFKFI